MNTGFLVINKPKGISSFNVIAQLRKITRIKKIGHSGTLDPLATGVLIVAVGRQATKQLTDLIKKDKTYTTTIKLGAVSYTYDSEGEITDLVAKSRKKKPSKKDVEEVIKKFIGEIEQMPPIFSAKKIGGVPAYKLARRGETVELQPSTVRIDSIKILKYKWPELQLEVECGSGTYIRSLAHDIGQELGVGGYITQLERTAIGKITIKKSVTLEQLTSDNWTKYLRKTIKP